MYYKSKYGKTRKIRAERLANNIPPVGCELPRVGTFGRLFKAKFTDTFRYIEDLRDMTEEELQSRTYIVVRSQKWDARIPYRKYYFVSTFKDRSLFETFYRREFKLGGCTCKDYIINKNECKHQKAVKMKYKRSLIRKLAITRPLQIGSYEIKNTMYNKSTLKLKL